VRIADAGAVIVFQRPPILFEFQKIHPLFLYFSSQVRLSFQIPEQTDFILLLRNIFRFSYTNNSNFDDKSVKMK
jgi:hypothetical protein